MPTYIPLFSYPPDHAIRADGRAQWNFDPFGSVHLMNCGNLSDCRRCERLVEWRETVPKRAAFRDEAYWRKPVGGMGDPRSALHVVGLAPAAHGANRTGRMFTGDRSGDWLLRAMYTTGFCTQATSKEIGDGLEMIDAYVTSIVKCAPPQNRPTGEERANCRGWLDEELSFRPPVIVTLGGMAFAETLRALGDGGETIPVPRPSFGHGETLSLERTTVLACYHPSQLNTSTGRLTEPMLLGVFSQARRLVDDLEYRGR